MIAKGAAARGHGRIVAVSSITAEKVYSNMAAYAASKAAVNQMSRVLAKEWARLGVNMNVVAPGYMETELTDQMWATEAGRKLLNRFPRRRIMNVEALDELVLYLCSDASAQVTGSIFTVDDGQTL
jgi:NAD(P)-dependent dehydrogenase (short-subunit alcohol dehydrogenase family)